MSNAKILITVCVIQTIFGCTGSTQTTRTYPIKQVLDHPDSVRYTVAEITLRPNQLRTYFTLGHNPIQKINIPTELGDFLYLPIDAQHALPNDAFLGPFYRQGRNYGPLGLMFRILDAKKAVLIWDTDLDLDYLEEERDTILTNQSVLLKKVFQMSNRQDRFAMLLPLRIQLRAKDKVFEAMVLQNFFKFEFRQVVDTDTLAIDIHAPSGPIICRYTAPGQKRDSLLSFQINEPFLFRNKWYRLQNLDFQQHTIDLVAHTTDVVKGYKEGYYTDLSTVQEITETHLLSPEIKIDWHRHNYFLLHFWGEWCGPCKQEIPALKEMESAICHKIQVIHYPFVFEERLLNRTLLAIREYGLSNVQSVCKTYNCTPEVSDLEGCSLAQYFRVTQFPQYILLDKDGKILYRGPMQKNGQNVLMDKIKELGLL